MVIIEAMATGKPVIASRAGGAVELFREDENAVSHEPGDAADLARQIERLSGSPELRTRLGEAGRITAQRLFGRDRLAEELVGFYRSVAEESLPKSDMPLRPRLRAVDQGRP
jgi:glycosyltransferase involved in cell wall biosynthesis